MKTFKIICFLILMGVLSAIILETCPYFDLRVTDRRWQWIRSRVVEQDKKKVDLAILGTSRVWGGIKPNRIKEKMGYENVWNLSFNWYGRDATYIMLKNLLDHHDVKHVVIEVTELEHHPDYYKPHAYAKYLISPKDAGIEMKDMMEELSFTQVISYSEDFKKVVSYGLEQIADVYVRPLRVVLSGLFNLRGEDDKLKEYIQETNKTNGFYVNEEALKVDPKFLERQGLMRFPSNPNKSAETMSIGSRADYYIRRIYKLCRKNGVKLSFLYFPARMNPPPSDHVYVYYETLGDFLIPDLNRFYRLSNWRNYSHVYKKGSDFLTDQLIGFLQNGKEISPYYKYYNSVRNKRVF